MFKKISTKVKKVIHKADILITGIILSNLINPTSVYASTGGGIADTKLATGIEKLIADGTSWLVGISVTLTVLLFIVTCIGIGMHKEDQEKTQWKKWRKDALIGGILVIVATSVIKGIASYFV